MMQEDKLLIKQTLADDEQAFHRLIMKYYTAIYALIMSWVKNPEDAKDLTQEVFLEAYQGLASLRQPEQFNFWLKKIAKYHCQDWLRKRQEPYLELSEDMIYDAPSVDEMLILRETLAKVMKAIDELPESESQLLKDRYLDDASYDELEAKHGLSQSVLAMRLVRAKQHVREKIKLMSGLWILQWHDVAKKILIGGIEAMKITAKVKLITIGVGAVLILGGIGTILWHHTQQNHQEPIFASQFQQKHQQKILSTSHYNNKIISQSDIDKPIEKQSKSQVSELAKPQSSSEVDSNSQRIAQPESKLTDIDKKKDKQDEKAKLKYEQGVESAKQQITELIVKYGEVVRGQEQYWSMSDSEKRKMDPNIADNYTDARRETGQVIMIAIANYVRLTGDHNASYPGGWIYEFGNKNSFHIAHE